MKIAQKLSIGFICISLLGAMIGYVALRQIIEIEDSSKDFPASLTAIRDMSNLNELAHLIHYYDEVLTQSARNYAFTSDKKWENRYRDAEPVLDKKIKEAIRKGDQQDKDFFKSVNEANLLLVEMEYAAINFVNNGLKEEAVKILDSANYWEQKAVYAKGLHDYKHRRGSSFQEAMLRSTQVAGQSLNKVHRIITNSRLTVSIVFMFVLVLGLIISIVISRSISRPIEALENSAIEISRGKLPGNINVKSSGEIGLLVQAFNRMVLDLKDQRERLVERTLMESLVESIREGVIMLDKKGAVAVMNPRAYELIGLNDKVSDLDEELYKRMKLVDLDKALKISIQRRTLIQKEIVMPDNRKQVILCNICPVKSKSVNLGTALTLRDITLEKEVDAAKTEFISTVSHELRTPLAITKEGLSLILDKIAGDVTKKQEMILTTAQQNISRLSRLINNLLDISKIEAGKMEINRAKVEAVSMTKAIIDEFEFKAKAKGIKLITNYPKEKIEVFADRDKIIQVFTNLINNALKFTVEGKIEVSAKDDGEFTEFTVADTGIGISQNDLKQTFGKFQQFGRSSGHGEKGTGLGLSIAKGIVDMHGGKIWVESELGAGTQFKFTLRKFSDDLPLHEFIQSKIGAAQKNAEHLSLVMVDLNRINGGQLEISDVQYQEHLKIIENLLNADLHRDGDATFRDATRCAALISDCDKGEVNIVSERIKGTMSRFVDREKLTGKVDVKVSFATYPDDARNSEELLKKITVV